MRGIPPEWTPADRLRKARESSGLKQQELAELTGISRASIVNYEAGKTFPRRPAMAAISMATGVPLWWLTGEAAPDGGDGDGGGDQHVGLSGWTATDTATLVYFPNSDICTASGSGQEAA